jgi:hypothetical protein
MNILKVVEYINQHKLILKIIVSLIKNGIKIIFIL